ncbi:hypothetical protein BH11PLA1_BH11PLA1_18060 [soil metagenome]
MSTRLRCNRARARALVLAAGLALGVAQVAAAATTATWTGAVNANWSNPANWLPAVVPINGGGIEYVVVIPTLRTVTVDAGMPANFVVNSISLPVSSTLSVQGARTVQIGDDSQLRGVVQALAGSALISTRAAGAPETTLTPTSLFASQSLIRSSATTLNIVDRNVAVNAQAQGAMIDLSSVNTLQYGLTSGTGVNVISAGSGGRVDLSHVTSMQQTGNGVLELNAGMDSVIELRSMSALNGVRLVIAGTGQIHTQMLTALDNSTLAADMDGVYTLSPLITSMTTSTRAGFELFRTTVNGRLNLGSLTTLNLLNASPTDHAGVSIVAESGVIDLRNLTTVNLGAEARLNVRATTGAIIDLASVVALPRTDFTVNTDARVRTGALALMDESTVQVAGGVFSAPLVTGMTARSSSGSSSSSLLFYAAQNTGSVQLAGLTGLAISSLAPGLAFTTAIFADGGAINLSALTTIARTNAPILQITVGPGGLIDLHSLAALSGTNSITVQGANARLDLSGLTSFVGDGNSNVLVQQGGRLIVPNLRELRNLNVNIFGGTVQTGILTSIDGSGFFVSGSTFATPAGVTAYQNILSQTSPADLTAQSGTLNFASLQSMALGLSGTSNRNVTYSASGAGSVLDLSNVAILQTASGINLALATTMGAQVRLGSLGSVSAPLSLTAGGAGSGFDLHTLTSVGILNVSATQGGTVSLPLLTTLTIPSSSISLTADGAGSVIALGALQNFGSTIARNLTASNGGVINLPGITSLSNVNLVLRGATSRINFAQLTSLNGVSLNISEGATFTTPASLTSLTLAAGATLQVQTQSTLNLASVTQLTYGTTGTSNGTVTLTSDTGGVLNLSGLTTFVPISTPNLSVRSFGSINLGGATTLPANTTVLASTGGTVALGSLTSLANSANVQLQVVGAGSAITAPNLATLGNQNTIFVSTGASAGFAVAALGAANTLAFSAFDAGSLLQLNSLTNLGTGTGRSFNADTNATIRVNTLTTLGGAATVNISAFANGVIDLPQLASLGTGAGRTIVASDGGRVNAPLLTQLVGADVTIRGAGVLTTGTLTSVDGSSFTIFNGAAFTTPAAVTSYAPLEHSAGTIFNAAGLNAQLDLRSLTSMTFGGAGTQGIVHTISAQNAKVDLSHLASLTRVNGGLLGVSVLSGGTVDLSGLTELRSANVTVNGGNLVLGALTSVDGSTFSFAARAFTLPTGVTSYSAGDRPTTGIFTAIDGVMDLRALTNISVGSTASTNAVHTLTALGNGARLDASNLAGITRVNGGILGVNASEGGQVNISGLGGQLNFMNLFVGRNSALITAPLTNIDGSTLAAESTTFVLPAAVTAYTPLSRGSGTIFGLGQNSTMATLLDLRALTALSFGSSSEARATHRVIPAGSGLIDLGNVTTLTRINGGFLELDGRLGTINVTGLTTLRFANLLPGSGGTIVLGALTSIDGSSIQTGYDFVLPAGVTSYAALDRGTGQLFSESGSGHTLDLRSLTALTFGSTLEAGAVHSIRALSSGSVVNLSNVTSLQGINGARLALTVGDNLGLIDLSHAGALNNVDILISRQSGRVLVGSVATLDGSTVALPLGGSFATPATVTGYNTGALEGGTIFSSVNLSVLDLSSMHTLTIGNAGTPGRIYTVAVSNNALLDLSGVTDITAATGSALQIVIANEGTARFGALTVSTGVRVQGSGGVLRIAGALVNQSLAPSDFLMTSSSLVIAGGITTTLEAAGINAGTAGTALINGGNFGLAQLRIGEGALAATLSVLDAFDNGDRGAGGAEALYLFGLGGQNGLLLTAGSRLVLDPSVHVYASIAGVMTDLVTLIPAGQTQVAYQGGTIAVPTPGAMALLAGAGLMAWRRRRSLCCGGGRWGLRRRRGRGRGGVR